VAVVAVVVSWNGRADTLACLESLRGIETIVVDNGSTDGSPEAVREAFPDAELVETGANLGYAGGNNAGIRLALGRGADWVLLVNNDATAEPGLAEALGRAAAARPDAGVLACKVLEAERPGVVQYAGAGFNPLLGYSGRQDGHGQPDTGNGALRDTGRATGAAMAVSRAAIERAGLLDETLFAYVEDVDWCLRIRRAGLAVVLVPDARVRHRGGASTGGSASPSALYYHTRNTLAVCERERPLPPGPRGLRRLVVVGTHLAQALRTPDPRAASAAVLEGWRDYRVGRMGPRP
jgi:hypothetical protein